MEVGRGGRRVLRWCGEGEGESRVRPVERSVGEGEMMVIGMQKLCGSREDQ